jgi:sodium transport system permease protein
MSPADPAIPKTAAAAPRWGIARLSRLARKELRETLRDRRTIVTLVLMPLLVYPLLSLAFKQFLMANLRQTGTVEWRVAATSQAELDAISKRVALGDKLLVEQRRRSGAGDDEVQEQALDNLHGGVVEDLESALRSDQFDLGVRVQPQPSADSQEPFLDFELVVRPQSPLSQQVADFIERRLQAVNDNFAREQLRTLTGSGRMPSTWRMTRLEAAQQESVWFATLVPLVLILMTITGAVYPAIDLTAGERERGTLEALMAAPVPRLALLIAKYVAVVTVAMLTAVVNLLAMTITVAATGLASELFGADGLSLGAMVAVLALLVLFAAFFSAVLLSITSFARSFKEAQAYLIPLMLVSLAPGFLSVMPGLELGPLLSVTPLANIVLLARDVLEGDASPLWGSVAVLTTLLYGALALALAARIFGSDAILYGSHGTWSDLFRRPDEPRPKATPAGALAALAVVAPLFVIASGLLVQLQGLAVGVQLFWGALLTLALFIGVPLLFARAQGVAIGEGFQLRRASLGAFAGAMILGSSLWMLAYNLIVLSQDLGIATIDREALAQHRPGLEALIEKWRMLPLPAILLALAVVPAVAEEFFFRGYLLGAMRGRVAAWLAIGLTAVVFGLFHASVGGLIAVERVLASTLLGVALGWVCWTTASVFPGMVLHALSNALMLSLAYYGDELKARGWDLEGQRYLPPAWTAAAGAVAAVGLAIVWLGSRGGALDETDPSDATLKPEGQPGREPSTPA